MGIPISPKRPHPIWNQSKPFRCPIMSCQLAFELATLLGIQYMNHSTGLPKQMGGLGSEVQIMSPATPTYTA